MIIKNIRSFSLVIWIQIGQVINLNKLLIGFNQFNIIKVIMMY